MIFVLFNLEGFPHKTLCLHYCILHFFMFIAARADYPQHLVQKSLSCHEVCLILPISALHAKNTLSQLVNRKDICPSLGQPHGVGLLGVGGRL